MNPSYRPREVQSTPSTYKPPGPSQAGPSQPRQPWSSAPSRYAPTQSPSSTTPGRSSNSTRGHTRPTPELAIYGDSFVGPFSLYRDSDRRICKFKGASAKGLNNPHSTLRIAEDLLPDLERHFELDALRRGPRFALLIFGNVDLQVNYLFNLSTKPLTTASVSPDHPLASVLPPPEPGQPSALGPRLHVEAVAKAYISFLDREIVRGPVGKSIQLANAELASSSDASADSRRASRVLVCGALPPVVPDDVQPRIPEKYVIRLGKRPDDDTERIDSRGRSDLSSALAKVSISSSDPVPLDTSPPPSVSSLPDTPAVHGTPIEVLLETQPGLLNLSVRTRMVKHFNSLLRDFCAAHPDILGFVDIGLQMLNASSTPGWQSLDGEVDQGTWRDIADPSNIHPLWEPALPFWLDALRAHGVAVDEWKTKVDPARTMRYFEQEKGMRVARRGYGSSSSAPVAVADSDVVLVPPAVPPSPVSIITPSTARITEGKYVPPHRTAPDRGQARLVNGAGADKAYLPSPPPTPTKGDSTTGPTRSAAEVPKWRPSGRWTQSQTQRA